MFELCAPHIDGVGVGGFLKGSAGAKTAFLQTLTPDTGVHACIDGPRGQGLDRAG